MSNKKTFRALFNWISGLTLASHGSPVTWNLCSPSLILVSKVPWGQCHGTWNSAEGSSSSLWLPPPLFSNVWNHQSCFLNKCHLWRGAGCQLLRLQLTPRQNNTGSPLIPLEEGGEGADLLYPGSLGPLCLELLWTLHDFYFRVINIQKINAKIIKVRKPGLYKFYVLGAELRRIWGKFWSQNTGVLCPWPQKSYLCMEDWFLQLATQWTVVGLCQGQQISSFHPAKGEVTVTDPRPSHIRPVPTLPPAMWSRASLSTHRNLSFLTWLFRDLIIYMRTRVQITNHHTVNIIINWTI